jgi:DNA-binding GntR family transcriptional regulator
MRGHKAALPQPVRSDSLSNQLFGILKEAIFAGKFQPGEALRELNLARTMDVSQATVREALNQLEQAGLVVRQPNRRTTVTSFTQDEVRDRLAMRIVLEELAFRKAAGNLSADDFEALEKLGADIEEGVRRGDCQRMTLADMSFHHFVWDKTGSPVITRTLDQLTTPLFAFLSVLHGTGMHDLRSGRPHSELIGALRGGKSDMIGATIRSHIGGSYRAFLESDTPSLDQLVQKPEALAGLRR